MRRTLMNKVNTLFANTIESFGYRISRIPIDEKFPRDMEKEFIEIHEKCRPFTGTGIAMQYALYKAVEYIVKGGIPGDLVECGVWRGGSAMIMAHVLMQMKETDRRIYLYDTFAGMTKPSSKDYSVYEHKTTMDVWENSREDGHNLWCYGSLDEVRNNMLSTGYPKENVIFIEGKVEDTLPKVRPSNISLLRLDTDWFDSTYCELQYLYPLLSCEGVMMIDDYGHWAGSREATDLYLRENKISMLLNRVNYTGRVGIKAAR